MLDGMPVPNTILDQTRLAHYEPAGSPGPFDITFPIFSAGDVRVLVDGVDQVKDTDWTFSGTFVNGVCLDGQVTLTAPTSDPVDIVGFRHPHRTDQFQEGRGVPARDLNSSQNVLAATVREVWDFIQGNLPLVPAGASRWRSGTGVPPDGLGNNGDFFLRDDTGDVYEKVAGVYVLRLDIKGPTGPAGPATPVDFDTVGAAELANVDPAAAYVRTAGFAVTGDQGAALYKRVGAEPTHAGKFQSADGAWWELSAPRVSIEMFGGGVGKSGAENATAIEGAYNYLLGTGGTIELPSGTVQFNNSDLPTTPQRITIEGKGRGATSIVPAEPDAMGAPTSWLWRIGDGITVTKLGLVGFTIQGDVVNRTRINGILIRKSNEIIVRDVAPRHLIGTGLKAERAHNSDIECISEKCGSSADGIFAQVYTGDPDDPAGMVANDVRFTGTTEQDELGIQITYMVNLRGSAPIKLHGSVNTVRALEMWKVGNFDLAVMPTLGYAGDGMIYIGDSGAVSPPTPPFASVNTVPYATGRLSIFPFENVENFSGGTEALLTIDINFSPSQVAIEGLSPILKGADYRYVHLTAVAGSGSKIDLSDFVVRDSDQSKWILDERTTGKALASERMSRLSGVQIGQRSAFPGNAAWQQRLSETASYRFAETVNGPIRRLLGVNFGATALETILFGERVLTYAFSGPFSATSWLVDGAIFSVPDTGQAIIRRVTVGLPAAIVWSGVDNWILRLYRVNATEDLNLATDRTFATDGAGFADRVLNASARQLLDYWSTPSSQNAFLGSNMLGLELVKSGAPADIDRLQVSIYFDIAA